MKTYYQMLLETPFIWFFVVVTIFSLVLYLFLGATEKVWSFSNLCGCFLSIFIFFSGSILIGNCFDTSNYNRNYITCHKQEAVKAGYKMIDKECYKPYRGFVPVNTNNK